jgi:di- and tripeptidase
MILAQGGIGGRFKEEEILLSGGGDGTIKLWTLDGDHSGAISELCVLDNGDFSVLSMVLDDTFLYAGLLEGSINVWDLDTQQLVRSVKAGSCDIWSVSVSSECILCATADGVVKVCN